MARRSQSPIEDLMDVSSILSWWVGMPLAVVSYFVLHWFANQPPPATAGGGDALFAAVLPSFIRMLATFGQIVLLVVFLFGAIVSAFNSHKR